MYDFNCLLLVNFNILIRICLVVFFKIDVKFINMNLIIEIIVSLMFLIVIGLIFDVGLFLFYCGLY